MMEIINFQPLPVLQVGNEQNKEAHATETQNAFKYINERAAGRGMLVNDSKTSMICVADTVSQCHKAFMMAGNERILSGK